MMNERKELPLNRLVSEPSWRVCRLIGQTMNARNMLFNVTVYEAVEQANISLFRTERAEQTGLLSM